MSRAIGKLERLQELYLGSNSIAKLPESFGELAKLQMLDMSKNRLASIPKSICSNGSLKSMDLSNNSLAALPDTMGALKNLVSLNLEGNRFTSLPDVLGSLTSITSIRVDPSLQKELFRATKKPELCYAYIIGMLNSPYEREKVLGLIESILETDPSIGTVWYFKGMYLAFMDRHDDANVAFRKAFELDPVLHKSGVVFKWAKYTIDLLLNLGLNEKATEAIQKFLETAPDELPLWEKLGDLDERLGKHAAAVKAYEKALSLYSVYKEGDTWPLMYKIGLIKQEMGDPAGARDYYKGLKWRWKEYCGSALIGDTYIQEGNTRKGIEFYLKTLHEDSRNRVKTWIQLIKLLPAHKLAWLVKNLTRILLYQEEKVGFEDNKYHEAGDALEERGFVDLAEQYYRACICSRQLTLEDSLSCRVNFIWMLKRAGQYGKARVECKNGLQQIVKEAPGNNDTGLYYTGYLRYEMADFSGALDAFLKYTERYPTVPPGWGMLCMSLMQASRFQEAIAAAQKAIDITTHVSHDDGENNEVDESEEGGDDDIDGSEEDEGGDEDKDIEEEGDDDDK